MTRTAILVAFLATSLGLFAQNEPANPAPPQSSMVEVPATNIYVVGGGLYGSGIYVNPPTAAAPAAPESTTGISLAGRAGISLNTPIDLGVQSTLTPTNPMINYGYAPSAYSASAPAAPESAESSGRVNDLLPASFVDSGTSASAAAGLSLAEIADQYRTNRRQAVRTFTNADVAKLTNKVTVFGVTTMGTETAPTAEPAITQPEAPATPTAEPAITQPQAPPEEPELAANANRPPVAPESRPAETATAGLPVTSTYLPLLGVLGLLSSGVGMWVRRFMK